MDSCDAVQCQHDDSTRMYEMGKSNAISDVYSMMERILTSGDDPNKRIDDFCNEFCKRYDGYIRMFGDTKPTTYEERFCYSKTISYRGVEVRLYDDDYGQQYYFYYKGRQYGCGAFNTLPERYVQYVINEDLDAIYDLSNTDIRYAGGRIEYSNHEHTDISFTYRMQELLHFHSDSGKFDIESIKGECLNRLEELFQSKEFIESEKERKASGSLFLNELMENKSHKEEE